MLIGVNIKVLTDKQQLFGLLFESSNCLAVADWAVVSSPTVSQESIMLTAVIDSKENRDKTVADTPNAFIQTNLPGADKAGQRVTVKVTGVLVELLVKTSPETYGPYVVLDSSGKKVLCVRVNKALYGVLVASLLWYKAFRRDLEEVRATRRASTWNLYGSTE